MRLSLLGLLAFALLLSLSAALYPGGTVFDPRSPGYSFWQNYYCDLLSPVALGGGDHVTGAWLARAAFVCFAVALWRFWTLTAGLVGGSFRAALTRGLGRFGALALAGVSSLPPSVSEAGHALLVLGSAGASIAAALVMIPALGPHVDRTTRALGIAVILGAVVTLGQYLQQGTLRIYFADWLPGAQKLTSLLLLAWMLRVLWWVGQPAGAGTDR